MTIETERLILRPFTEADAADVYEYLREPAVHCFACMKLHSLEEAVEEMKRRSGETEYWFAIVLKETGKAHVCRADSDRTHRRRREKTAHGAFAQRSGRA